MHQRNCERPANDGIAGETCRRMGGSAGRRGCAATRFRMKGELCACHTDVLTERRNVSADAGRRGCATTRSMADRDPDPHGRQERSEAFLSNGMGQQEGRRQASPRRLRHGLKTLAELFWASLHGIAELTRTKRFTRSRQKERVRALVSLDTHVVKRDDCREKRVGGWACCTCRTGSETDRRRTRTLNGSDACAH